MSAAMVIEALLDLRLARRTISRSERDADAI
jgi:hypothetical protein